MSATVNIHGARKATARVSGSTEWLEIEARNGTTVAIFMPLAVAHAMADAFNASHAPEPGTLSPINGEDA